MAWLITSKNKRDRYVISLREVHTIGSLPSNSTVWLRAPPRACILGLREDRWVVRNSCTPPAVEVNGRIVEDELALSEGDRVTVGGVEVTFSLDDAHARALLKELQSPFDGAVYCMHFVEPRREPDRELSVEAFVNEVVHGESGTVGGYAVLAFILARSADAPRLIEDLLGHLDAVDASTRQHVGFILFDGHFSYAATSGARATVRGASLLGADVFADRLKTVAIEAPVQLNVGRIKHATSYATELLMDAFGLDDSHLPSLMFVQPGNRQRCLLRRLEADHAFQRLYACTLKPLSAGLRWRDRLSKAEREARELERAVARLRKVQKDLDKKGKFHGPDFIAYCQKQLVEAPALNAQFSDLKLARARAWADAKAAGFDWVLAPFERPYASSTSVIDLGFIEEALRRADLADAESGADSKVRAFDLLCALIPVQFDEALFRAQIPVNVLPGHTAPQVERARAAVEYASSFNAGALSRLMKAIGKVRGEGAG
ncbi:FHA domain-containing protein [Sorangium sp. So ce388]|uniref:FHA domain-containing protein n=1 Tax=Sorangium sp. So ce388 TaxID=3133309 RepID=UPI003F5C166F